MSKPSKAVILAEDEFTQRFIYRYLSRLRQFRNPRYDIRGRLPRKGQGSGEQWVREQYVNEVRAQRSKQVHTALVVVIDADIGEIGRRTRQFQDSIVRAGLSPRTAKER